MSYRNKVFNHDREPRSRARLLAGAGAVAVVAGVGVAMLIPNVGSVFGASNAANALGACATPSATTTAAGTAAGATAAAGTTAATTAASASPSAVAPTPTGTVAAPTATAPASTAAATTAPSTAAATTAPSTAAATTAPSTAAATTAATPCASTSATATATAPAAAANVSCDIVVPANPLSAQGLATPYQLTGPNGMTAQASGCTMANSGNLGAFVQATILDPATGKLSVYEPLVITQGTQPAAAPTVPTLPANAVVTIDFGFNGTNLTLVGATGTTLAQGRCVNGLNGSIFGQVSFCNGTGFFQAARRAQAAGLLAVPAAGTSAKTGQPCPTTRNFNMIDQDQSDNVTTQYLLTANGQTAQFSAANQGNLAGATTINNGSDNALLDAFLDPTLGCTPFTAPDLTMGGTASTSQALDELSAAKNQAAPVALVPENDEMVLVNNAFNVQKTNLYRSNVGQAPISAANQATDSPANYCQNMVNVQTAFLANNQALLATGTSPVPTVGNNLFTFLANRLNMSFTNLNCQNFGLTNPVTVTLDGNGVATAATFNTAPQKAAAAAGAAAGRGATARRGRAGGVPGTRMQPVQHRIGRGGHHGLMDPSGM